MSIVVREVARVADCLYLVAHDPASGRPRLGPRLLGVGMAAAVLGELVLGGFVDLQSGKVWPTDLCPYLRRVRHHLQGLSIMGVCPQSHRRVSHDRPIEPCYGCGSTEVEVVPDELAWGWRELIAQERVARPVTDWQTLLAPTALAKVAERLEMDGWLVSSEQRRGLLRPRLVRYWEPANLVEADAPRQALRRITQGVGERPRPHQVVLAALVDVLQLSHVVVEQLPDPAAAAQALATAIGRLDGSLRHLVEQTAVVAGNAVVAHAG